MKLTYTITKTTGHGTKTLYVPWGQRLQKTDQCRVKHLIFTVFLVCCILAHFIWCWDIFVFKYHGLLGSVFRLQSVPDARTHQTPVSKPLLLPFLRSGLKEDCATLRYHSLLAIRCALPITPFFTLHTGTSLSQARSTFTISFSLSLKHTPAQQSASIDFSKAKWLRQLQKARVHVMQILDLNAEVKKRITPIK